ncbi:MAG: bifunctional diaminohydroxyphosphoribosylaminopyrimidine deaminase/5-amino-6-(5-phosphoribosylamino)uracil reductase RibD [Acidobacteria bacterium]|nr:bifunctional diaminohydroxyphosphoribosylaminopyrimidine deaminase/5-amino-6-(5-phosphoribosylamino)uracil reductase RibD [Acidobacteriota bacterium]
MFRIEFMQRALNLAKRGLGSVSPNPAVGCVIVKNGRIIGEGYHGYFGGPHAEINAIESASEPVSGSDVYVTLEPCSHHGKTPPCAERLIREKVKQVFIAAKDPNPLVSGNGIRQLKASGIEVHVGYMEKEAREINRFFIHYISTGMPYIILKAAVSLDGFIADTRGNSKWISNEASREDVHRIRSRTDAVLVGAGTVRSDNPKLTVRLVEGRNPRRIVLNRSGSLPPESEVFAAGTILVTAPDAMSREKKSRFIRKGVELLEQSGPELSPLLKSFATMGMASILVEGGTGVFSSFVKEGFVNEFLIYVAPLVLGRGKPLFDFPPGTMSEAIRLSGRDTRICLRGL